MARRATGAATSVAGLIEAGWTPSAIAAEARIPGPGPVLRVLRGRQIHLDTAGKLVDAGLGLTFEGLRREIERARAKTARSGRS